MILNASWKINVASYKISNYSVTLLEGNNSKEIVQVDQKFYVFNLTDWIPGQSYSATVQSISSTDLDDVSDANSEVVTSNRIRTGSYIIQSYIYNI